MTAAASSRGRYGALPTPYNLLLTAYCLLLTAYYFADYYVQDRKRLAAEIAELRRRDRWWVRRWTPWGRWLGQLVRRPATRATADAKKRV